VKNVIRSIEDHSKEKERHCMNIVDKITEKQMRPDIPEFRVGDTVKVDVKIVEGKRERIQAFEGIVTARKGRGISETFTVTKKSSGIGVDRVFPVNSPKIAALTVIKKGKVRRAKLRFLKGLKGVFKIKERN
jgi:large subunit ribosomal protein L19